MLQIQNIKLPVEHTEEALRKKIQKVVDAKPEELLSFQIKRCSIDARKKPNIIYIYTIYANFANEKKILKRNLKDISGVEEIPYTFMKSGTQQMAHRPIIVGSGPAGLFCAYMLAKAGYQPLVLERGEAMRERKHTVEAFWRGAPLNTESNVQFGEGGAGTFSDGKLNTQIKDPLKRNTEILRLFVKYGAPAEILYSNKPHIGTDILESVIVNIRHAIENMGGKFEFSAKLMDIIVEEGKLTAIKVLHTKNSEIAKEIEYPAETLVLALGHSARDTFEQLYKRELQMEAKAFAVGVRIMHLQEMINKSQYGEQYPAMLPSADYKLTAQTTNGRGVYSFCMCPGGYVVNASSEKKYMAVNGMSDSKRDGLYANSAIVTTVSPTDFKNAHPLAGIIFQRELEEKAYSIGKGKIPIQTFGAFTQNKEASESSVATPAALKGSTSFGNVRAIFPNEVSDALEEGILLFDKKIRGFADANAFLAGVESRTSSPVRMVRDSTFESPIKGIFPCGEGAGYAGGITSAAADGLKVAEEIARRFHF